MKAYNFTFDKPKLRYQFKTISEVWAAIDAGKTVYWASDAYALTIEHESDDMKAWRVRHGYPIPVSARGDKVLRVTCISNYFGSLLDSSEISSLYTKE